MPKEKVVPQPKKEVKSALDLKLDRMVALNKLQKECKMFSDLPVEYAEAFKSKFDQFIMNLINEEMGNELIEAPYMKIGEDDIKVLDIVKRKYNIYEKS